MVFLTSQVKINNSFLTLYSVVSLLSVIFYVKYVLVFFFSVAMYCTRKSSHSIYVISIEEAAVSD